jgi:hypothetical protein
MGKTESLKLHNISIDATVCRFGVPWVESRLIFMQKIVVRLRLVSPFVHDGAFAECASNLCAGRAGTSPSPCRSSL